LRDRVDLRVHIHRERAEAFAAEEGESSALVRERMKSAREAAAQRWEQHGIRTDADGTAEDGGGLLSIRGIDRTLRIAWTLADLIGRTSPGFGDVTTALMFRQAGGAQ
jgi:magnesium chelatase family protein